MQKFSEYINESVFDIEKNIESAPDWERILIDFYKNNGGVISRGTGVDCLGRKVEPGNWVIFLNSGDRWGSGKQLSIGKAISVKKNVQIALIVPEDNRLSITKDDMQFISRPSEYVFKISAPELLAAEIA